MFLGGCPCCGKKGPCWRCYTDGTDYECIGPNDTPKDGWTPVGDCQPDEASCSEGCGPEYCFYTDYQSICSTNASKPDEMVWKEPNISDCAVCFSECPDAAGYQLAHELQENSPAEGDLFFGEVVYNGITLPNVVKKSGRDDIDGIINKSIRYQSVDTTVDCYPEDCPVFEGLIGVSHRNVSMSATFLYRIENPYNSSKTLFSLYASKSGPTMQVSIPQYSQIIDNELAVSFAGEKVVSIRDRGGSVCFEVPCKSSPFCSGDSPGIDQDDFFGTLVINYKGKEKQAFNTLMPFEVNYSIELPTSFYKSHCWMCPDDPKPTLPIDYDALNLIPVSTTPNRKGKAMPTTTTTTGPGTHLKNMLGWVGIRAKEKGCGCRSYQKKMDRGGPQWCRDHKEEILDHLAKEAKKRGLPFVKLAASKLVDLAIRRADRGQ